MTNPKHTDTSRSGDLVERLRGDWPEILVEKHWMMDSDAIDKQREEAADRIEALEAENERLKGLITNAANHWLALQGDHPIYWEGAIDAAMEAACNEVRRLSAALGEKQ